VDAGGPNEAQVRLHSPDGANVPIWEGTLTFRASCAVAAMRSCVKLYFDQLFPCRHDIDNPAAFAANSHILNLHRYSKVDGCIVTCVKCQQYSIRLEMLGFSRDCISGRVQKVVKVI